MDCEHRWGSDKEERLCILCGEVRTFPTGDEHPRVVWPGHGAEQNPADLPKGDKALIARVARGHVDLGTDLNRLGELTGIKMFLLRGWVGALSRGKKAEPTALEEAPAAATPAAAEEAAAKPRKHKQIGRYYEQNKALLISDYQSMTLLEFFKKWHISSSSWRRLRDLWRVPKKGRGGKARLPASSTQEAEPGVSLPATKTAEEISNLVMEVLYLRGYQQAVRDVFDCRPGHEYGRQADGHRKHLNNVLARVDQDRNKQGVL